MKQVFIKFALFISSFISLSFNDNEPKTVAVFRAIKMELYTDTLVVASGYAGIASLYESPTINGLNPYKTIKDGVVMLNGVQLGYNDIINTYIDSTQRTSFDSVTWNISSSSNFINNDYIVAKSIPSFTNVALIPNTISKSQDLIIPLGEMKNIDRIEFNINNNTTSIDSQYFQKMTNNSENIIIQKKTLDELDINNESQIIVTFINEEEKTIDNKKYLFENRYELTKNVSIIN